MDKLKDSEIAQIFGESLRAQRGTKGITQEELAYRAGVDRTFVSRIERGIRQPTLTTLVLLARALQVPLAQLIAATDAAFPSNRRGESKDSFPNV